MTSNYIGNLLVEGLIGWLAVLALSVVGYLAYLQLKDFRRNRRMDARRERRA
jgi:hypothetical protein